MVIEQLKQSSALLEGHFLLSSGRHSNRYCQCAKLLQYPDKAAKVLAVVAEKLKDIQVDIVVGPAMGGIIVAYELGRQLGIPAIFTEREEGKMTLRRGFEVHAGQRVLITEDVITTGKSSLETIDALKQYDVEIVGIACIVNRSTGDVGYPVFDAISLDIESWEPENCPLCKQCIPMVKPGSRKLVN